MWRCIRKKWYCIRKNKYSKLSFPTQKGEVFCLQPVLYSFFAFYFVIISRGVHTNMWKGKYNNGISTIQTRENRNNLSYHQLTRLIAINPPNRLQYRNRRRIEHFQLRFMEHHNRLRRTGLTSLCGTRCGRRLPP